MDRSKFPPGDLVLVNLPVPKRRNLLSERNQRSGFWPAKVTNKIKNSKVKRDVVYYGTHEEAMVPLQSIVAYNQQNRNKHISPSRENKDSVLAQALAKIEADFTAKSRTAEELHLSGESNRITSVVKSAKLLEINQLENTFMNLWNSYVDKSVGMISGMCHLPRILTDFVNQHKEEMSQEEIYKDFLLHVNSLEEMGAISSSEIKNIAERLADVSIDWNKEAKRNYDGPRGSTATGLEDDNPDEVAETSPGEVPDTSPDEVADTSPDEVTETSPDEVAETSADEVAETSADKVAQITDEMDEIPPAKILGGFHTSTIPALFTNPIQTTSLTNDQTLNVINAPSDHVLSGAIENVSRGDELTVEETVEECDNNNSNKTNEEVETSASIEEVEILDALNNVTGTAEVSTVGEVGAAGAPQEKPTSLDNDEIKSDDEVEMIEAIGTATFVMKVSDFTDVISAGVTKRKRPSEAVTTNKKRLPGYSVDGGISDVTRKSGKPPRLSNLDQSSKELCKCCATVVEKSGSANRDANANKCTVRIIINAQL